MVLKFRDGVFELSKFAKFFSHGGDVPEGGVFPKGFFIRSSGGAVLKAAGFDVSDNVGTAEDNAAISDGDVIGDPDLSCEHHSVSDLTGSGDTDLGANEAVFSNGIVVSNLDEIVDLRALFDAAFADGGEVDGAGGPDFDVVFENDRSIGIDPFLSQDIGVGVDSFSGLCELELGSLLTGEAEAIGADAGIGFDDDTVADANAGTDADAGVKEAIGADLSTFADGDVREDACIGADGYFWGNGHVWADGRGGIDFGGLVHESGWMDTGICVGRWGEDAIQGDKGEARAFHDEDAFEAFEQGGETFGGFLRHHGGFDGELGGGEKGVCDPRGRDEREVGGGLDFVWGDEVLDDDGAIALDAGSGDGRGDLV